MLSLVLILYSKCSGEGGRREGRTCLPGNFFRPVPWYRSYLWNVGVRQVEFDLGMQAAEGWLCWPRHVSNSLACSWLLHPLNP